ncbi:MAG: DUF1015 family protein, partial [Clostridiales bacterium]|nr:DUF1015 family protein [Clostridiales bacterium]
MPKIYPFRALRPVPELASKVAALPYDVMNADEAREMVQGNEYSFLHTDKAEIDLPAGINVYDDVVYAKAKDNLNKLIENKILIQDESPRLYVYRLIRNGKPQTGIVACVSANDYIENIIKKHEFTRADKERDRIRHVETLNAQTGPIFLAHQNDENIKTALCEITKTEPVYDFTAEDDVRHTIWIAPDNSIAGLYEALPAFYIADGHHRAAAAVKTAQNRNFEGESGIFLAVVFAAEELTILDYNRLVKLPSGIDKQTLLIKLAEKFTIEKSLKEAKPTARHTFGMYDGEWHTITLKDGIADESDAVASLDVSVLQNEVLAPLFGIDDPRTSKNVDFVGGIRGLAELSRRVDSGEFDVAFAMFPTSLNELMSVADSGAVMPPKSTWFEPKLRSGLFIHTLS